MDNGRIVNTWLLFKISYVKIYIYYSVVQKHYSPKCYAVECTAAYYRKL